MSTPALTYRMAFYGPRPIPNLDSLPVEVVLLVVEYIGSDGEARHVNRNLLSLSRASWRLGRIITPYLYKHNVKNMGSSGFKWAIQRGNLYVIKTLLDYGGDITSFESGYPLLMTIKKGDVELLRFVMLNASEDAVTQALSQEVDVDKNTLLHWAIFLAHVPCVKVLLEAGVDMSAMNKDEYRPIDYLFTRSQSGVDSRYAEVVKLLLDSNPVEMVKPLVDQRNFNLLGRTTPLILAAKSGSLVSVNAILEAARRHNTENSYRIYINEVCTLGGWTALASICDPSNWPGSPSGRERVLAIINTLLLHGADVNGIDQDMEGKDMLPIYRSCLRPPLLDDAHQRLGTTKLQHDIISLLIDNNANVKVRNFDEWFLDYCFPCMKFLETAEYYSIYILEPGKLFLKDEDILQDTHPTLRFETTSSSSHNVEAEPEEEGNAEILRLLQNMFRKLLQDMTPDDFKAYRGERETTLLHRAAIIPGPFGVWATQTLLEMGASTKTVDELERTPLKYAKSQGLNRVSISLLRRWPKAS
ncbi:hypothetical protein UA08_07779 [Talaromyces atroroseus]|uniref:F-box domain-containing protein n=1 Tax=Talaromyces atroroseus TaxID=1441469 RepID=A0A225AFV5_TALAT|nr:hypothetical protein UA08_07779 [Talaromyces atroroseus]OKL56974.1 hypothetical protein UA08_07779 [Talaromyces atroroseus]